MNRCLIRRILPICLLLVGHRPVSAQFYPDSLANWCLYNNASPDGMYYVMHQPGGPDTTIESTTYKRIDAILINGAWPLCFDRYYVRSDADGKGYMFIPDLGYEVMTGDLNAEEGDTLHDVLVADGTASCQDVIYASGSCILALADLVVSSIDTITALGVTVVRHQLEPTSCPNALGPVFWQAGIGTAHGPLLILSIGLAHIDLQHASVGNTCYYNWSTSPQGLPGGPACCVVLPDGINDVASETVSIHPIPSPGLFRLSGSRDPMFRVLDQHGHEVVWGQGNVIDLSASPAGVYTAMITNAHTRQVIRLIVVR